MSVNSKMQTIKASQEWTEWMEKRNPEAAKRRKHKSPKQNYLEYLEDDDFDF
jgi:hypothetical protein